MRNKYPGNCYKCGSLVPKGEGFFERHFGTWRTQHATCAGVGDIRAGGLIEKIDAIKAPSTYDKNEQKSFYRGIAAAESEVIDYLDAMTPEERSRQRDLEQSAKLTTTHGQMLESIEDISKGTNIYED